MSRPASGWKPPTYRPLFCEECKEPFQPLGKGHSQGCAKGERYKVPPLINEGWRFLVFGGRHVPLEIFPKVSEFLDDVLAKHPDMVLMHGGAQGIDFAAKAWAEEHGVAQEVWQPAYDLLGWWRAPLWRNAEMAARKPEAGVGFIGPCGSDKCHSPSPHGSHGSVDMAVRALALGIPVFPHVWGGLDQLAAWMMSGDADRSGRYKPRGDGS